MQCTAAPSLLLFLTFLADVGATPNPSSKLPTRVGQNKAIVPTASGQIGIDPVQIGLADPGDYFAKIQDSDTKYITLTDSTTKWIGVNTEYLEKTTLNPTSTTEMHFIKATGTAKGGKNESSLLFSKPLAEVLKNSAVSAVDACNPDKAKHRRGDGGLLHRGADDVFACLVNNAHTVATGAALAKFASDATWAALGLEAAADAAAIVTTTIAAISIAESCKFLILMGVFMIALNAFAAIIKALGSDLTGPWASRWNVAKINLPQGGKGMMNKPEDKRCTGKEQKNDESPLCFRPSCLGIGEKCTMRPFENCPCWEILEFDVPQRINQSTFDFQQDLLKIAFTIDDHRPAPATKPTCNMSDVSAFPSVLFKNVYKNFCDVVVRNDSYHPTTWIVDSSGNRIPPRKDKTQKRTPPADPETFKDYKINLFFTPDPDTHFSCGKGCKEAFDMIANSRCGSADSQQYSMTMEANLDVGCGNYTYKIDAPPEKPRPSPPQSSQSLIPWPTQTISNSLPDPSVYTNLQTCYKPDEFGQHPQIWTDDCKYGAKNLCENLHVNLPPNGMKAGDKPFTFDTKSRINSASLHYEISCIDGCSTSQSQWPNDCDKFYQGICDFCQDSPNHCTGGWRNGGCLKYDFKPQ